MVFWVLLLSGVDEMVQGGSSREISRRSGVTVALSRLIEELPAQQWSDRERGRDSLVKYHFAHYSFNAAGFTSGASLGNLPVSRTSRGLRVPLLVLILVSLLLLE